MLTSIAIILLLGLLVGWFFSKLRLPILLKVSVLDAAIMGSVIAAVSPAVVVPRMTGVALLLVKTDLSIKERLFCIVAYTPKATAQAAIGSIPLTMGLSCGVINFDYSSIWCHMCG